MKIKKLEFETSKGNFVMVDTHGRDNYYETLRSIMPNEEYIGLLKELTEEQASGIVGTKYNPRNYGQYNPTSIYRLHSLIKSKGLYLDNPYKKPEHYDLWAKYGYFTQYGKSLTESVEQWQQAESRTLHKPVVFKIK